MSLAAAWMLTSFLVATPTTDAPATLDEVTVESTRRRTLEHSAHHFVHELTHALPESLSRWSVPVCPLVAGFPRADGNWLLARLSQRIREVGAPLAAESCEPNLYIVVTADPAAFLKAWRKRDQRLYGDGYEARIRRFVADERAVRVWHNVSFDSPTAGLNATDSPAASLPGKFGDARLTQSYSATRLQYTEVRGFATVIAIVDPRSLAGLPLGALGDYLVMTALTELDPDTRIEGVPSILSLFRNGRYDATAPTEWSAWDAAFLKGLYSSDPRETTQRSVIATRIVEAVGGSPH
jgi:hypothetical protein